MTISKLDRKKVAGKHTNSLSNVSPYCFIMDPGVCLLKNGALMATYMINYPDLESSSAPDIASVSALFNRSVMSLAQEEGWAVFLEVKRYKTREYPSGTFSNLAGWLIDQRRAENFAGYGEHFTSDYFVTFCWQLPSDMESKTNAVFFTPENRQPKSLRKRKDHDTFIDKFTNLPVVQKEVDSFLDECEKVMGSMTSKLWIKRLNHSELFSYIKSSVSLTRQNLVYPKGTFFFLDNYLFDMDVKTTIPLQVGKHYVPVISVMDFPTTTYPAVFDNLNRAKVEYRWMTRFIPLSKEKSLKEAEKYQKKMFSARKSLSTLFTEFTLDTDIDREDQGALTLESEANQLISEITSGEYLLGYYTSTLMVWDRDLEKAKLKSRKLQQVIRSVGFSCREESLNNFAAWLGMLPGDVYSNVRRPLINTRNFSHVIPLSSAWQGQYRNDQFESWCGTSVPLCVCSTSYGTPFFLNLNVGDVGNTFIFGPVGSGKSTLIATLLASATKYPDANIICIDKQLSSRAFMVAAGGFYVEPAKDEVAFQPLSELLNPDECSETEYNESLQWCQQFIEGLLSQQNIETTPDMSKVISQTLRQIARNDALKDLTSFQQYATYTDPATGANTIRDGLEPYCRGNQFGSIFDAEKTTLKLQKLLTVEMGSLMRLSEKAVAPALMYLFRYLEKIWNVGHGQKQPVTFLFLDEAWLYLQNPIFSGFLQEWLRTLRKKRVFCIFATQEVSAAANSPLRDTIAQQCLTKIYLADESAYTPALAESYRFFGLTDSEINALSNATMKRDYYFKNPRGCRMFQLDLDAFQLALLSSDHELLDKLEDRYGKNTGRPLAFELLDYVKAKYEAEGKSTTALDYRKYKAMLDKRA